VAAPPAAAEFLPGQPNLFASAGAPAASLSGLRRQRQAYQEVLGVSAWPSQASPAGAPSEVAAAMRRTSGLGEYVANLGEPPSAPDSLRVNPKSEVLKTPLQVLKEIDAEAAKTIEDQQLDLIGAWERLWSTLDPPETLACWGEALEEIGVEPWAAERLRDLASHSAMGRAEASKILWHLFKGSSKGNPSKYLISAVSDAWRYMDDWALYESASPDWGRGLQGWGRSRHSRTSERSLAPPSTSGQGASSSSSAAAPPPAPPAPPADPDDAWANFRPGNWSS